MSASYSLEKLKEAVAHSINFAEVRRYLNLSPSGSAYAVLRAKIHKNDIDISHFTHRGRVGQVKSTFTKVLTNDINLKNRRSGKQLTKALLESGRQYKCEKCKLNKWCEQNITLEVHHIDGNWQNNLSSNLDFLCPNCHSLTSNFYNKKQDKAAKSARVCSCGREISRNSKRCGQCWVRNRQRKVEWPTKEKLYELVWSIPSKKIAEIYGVSDTAIVKWCIFYGIEKPSRGYWQKINKHPRLV